MNRPHRSCAKVCARHVIALAVLVAATGCGGERAQRATEVLALRTQVDELRRGQETSAKELARVSGEVKALDAQSAFLVGEAKTTSEELARMRVAIAENQKVLAALRSSAETADKPGLAAAPAAAASPRATAGELHALALAHIQADESDRALQELTAITKRFPEHPLAASAQYWIGEVYYRGGDFSRALAEFRRVIDGYPKSSPIPESLLKIGACYRALKDQGRAREVWQQLTKEFPGTNAATQARALLSDAAGRPAKTDTR